MDRGLWSRVGKENKEEPFGTRSQERLWVLKFIAYNLRKERVYALTSAMEGCLKYLAKF